MSIGSPYSYRSMRWDLLKPPPAAAPDAKISTPISAHSTEATVQEWVLEEAPAAREPQGFVAPAVVPLLKINVCVGLVATGCADSFPASTVKSPTALVIVIEGVVDVAPAVVALIKAAATLVWLTPVKSVHQLIKSAVPTVQATRKVWVPLVGAINPQKETEQVAELLSFEFIKVMAWLVPVESQFTVTVPGVANGLSKLTMQRSARLAPLPTVMVVLVCGEADPVPDSVSADELEFHATADQDGPHKKTDSMTAINLFRNSTPPHRRTHHRNFLAGHPLLESPEGHYSEPANPTGFERRYRYLDSLQKGFVRALFPL